MASAWSKVDGAPSVDKEAIKRKQEEQAQRDREMIALA